jgi:hypothetical protein
MKKHSIKSMFFRHLSRIHHSAFISQLSSLIVLFLVLSSSFSLALPQAMVIYYGQACNEYGWPYLRDANVILRSGTNEVARHHINGSISPGINFALYVALDDASQSNAYSNIALQPGDPVEIYIQDVAGV